MPALKTTPVLYQEHEGQICCSCEILFTFNICRPTCTSPANTMKTSPLQDYLHYGTWIPRSLRPPVKNSWHYYLATPRIQSFSTCHLRHSCNIKF